jgi:hypothetical protein
MRRILFWFTVFLLLCVGELYSPGIEVGTKYPAPLPLPDWLRNHQRFLFDVGAGSLEEAAEDGADIVCGGTNAGGEGLVGGAYVWDGKDTLYFMWDRKPADVKSIRARVQKAHNLGLKVVGELMRMWHPEMLQLLHPEWQELRSPDQKPVKSESYEQAVKGQNPVTGCWISPFGEFYIQQAAQLVKQLDWDGASLDGFGSGTVCYCKFCQEAFENDMGKPIPRPPPVRTNAAATWAGDVGNPDFRRYLRWRLNRWTQYVYRLQQAVKAVKPEFALMPWSTAPGRAWSWSFAPIVEGSDAGNRLLDAPTVEMFWDFAPDQSMNLLPSFTVRYYLGLSQERPVFCLPYQVTQGQVGVCPPQVECEFRLYSMLASGARTANFFNAHLNRDVPLKHYLGLIREREPWINEAKSVKWAALLVSESSRLLYGISESRSELGGGWIGSGVDSPDASKLPPSQRRLPAHLESAMGVYRAAVEDHLPIDIISDQDVEEGKRLGLYKVLILPNAACVSDRAAGRIRDFVRAGGGLVAMHESSLYNENGDHRQDFALGDIFGASFGRLMDCNARWPEFSKTASIAFRSNSITDSPVVQAAYRKYSKSLPFIGWTADVTAQGGSRLEAVRGGEQVDFVKDSQAGSSGGHPFLLTSEPGKGRAVYFAADVGQSYFVTPFTHERPWLTQSIRWAAGQSEPPVGIQAPKCVQSTFYAQEKPHRIIVHLLNEINTTGNRALPENDPPAREEIIPLAGIKVNFRQSEIKSIFQEPGHVTLPMVRSTTGVETVVPKLELHTMVVAELEDQ